MAKPQLFVRRNTEKHKVRKEKELKERNTGEKQ